MTITEFLEARIAEDEADTINRVVLRSEDRRSLTMDQAERAHAEIAAKRAILADRKRMDRNTHDDDWTAGYSDGNYQAINALAAVYRDHPDYRQEWA